jgi:hypothetical protein
VFRYHGLLDTITSDRGPQFISIFWRHMCKLLHTSCEFSSDYHPNTNGQGEHTNQTLQQYLHCFVNYQHKIIRSIFYTWQNLLTITWNILLLDIHHFLRTLGSILIQQCLNIQNSRQILLPRISSSNSKKFRLTFCKIRMRSVHTCATR